LQRIDNRSFYSCLEKFSATFLL